MFPAEALPAVWMEDQIKIWEERRLNEKALKAEAEAKLAQAQLTQTLAAAQNAAGTQPFKHMDTMPSPSATSAFFGWFSPMLGRDNRGTNFSLASSIWKSPTMGSVSAWTSAMPTRVSSPVNGASTNEAKPAAASTEERR